MRWLIPMLLGGIGAGSILGGIIMFPKFPNCWFGATGIILIFCALVFCKFWYI